jgi:CRISPR-associated protein Cas6
MSGAPEMTDLVFDLNGVVLPANYQGALWAALSHHAPRLAQESAVGILPLRGTTGHAALLLSKRTKLALRVPRPCADYALSCLAQRQLDLAGNTLHLGAGKIRPIQPYPTIHAQVVAGPKDEVQFMEHMQAQLNAIQIKGRLICGRHTTIDTGQRTIEGYSLVIHDLKPDASLQLQYAGLGEERQYGCGIFVPYKVISGLAED